MGDQEELEGVGGCSGGTWSRWCPDESWRRLRGTKVGREENGGTRVGPGGDLGSPRWVLQEVRVPRWDL